MSFKTSNSNDVNVELEKKLSGKKVLYVATTYLEYLRIQQEIKLVGNMASSVDVLVSQKKSYFIRLLYVFWKLLILRTSRYDVIFIGFAPQLVLPFFNWKLKKKEIIIDFFISFYDTLVFDRKKFRKGSLIARLLLKLDKRTIQLADCIVADTIEHALYFRDELTADEAKLLVLYLAADRKFYSPIQVEKEDKYQDKYVVLYFATVLPLQGVDIVIKAVAQIHNPDIHFVFVGPIDQAQKEVLLQQQNLTYHAWLEQHQLAKMIAQSDLCLAGHFNSDIDKAKRTIPGKAYIFEAMGKTIMLGDNKANQERYPSEYQAVKYVAMGSSEAISTGILNTFEEFTNE